MTASTSHRLVVPAPEGGWLTLFDPESGDARLSLAEDWRLAAKGAIAAARVPELGRVSVHVEARPQRIAPAGFPGIHHQEDVRPSLMRVYEALRVAGVIGSFVAEKFVLGSETGQAADHGYLVLTLSEVSGVR